MGVCYAVIACGMLAYAWAMHRIRRYRIVMRYPGHHDEPYGPVVVCGLIFVAVLVNFVLRVRHRCVGGLSLSLFSPSPSLCARPAPRRVSFFLGGLTDVCLGVRCIQGGPARHAVAQEPVDDDARARPRRAQPPSPVGPALRPSLRPLRHAAEFCLPCQERDGESVRASTRPFSESKRGGLPTPRAQVPSYARTLGTAHCNAGCTTPATRQETQRHLDSALPLDHLHQLSCLLHLLDDVEPADKLALDDELREGRPLVELLELCRGARELRSAMCSQRGGSGARGGERHGSGWGRDALCRTPSSFRMSKVVYSTLLFSRMPTIFCEKPHLERTQGERVNSLGGNTRSAAASAGLGGPIPQKSGRVPTHRGVWRSPFMKRTTSACFISASHLFCSSSSLSSSTSSPSSSPPPATVPPAPAAPVACSPGW